MPKKIRAAARITMPKADLDVPRVKKLHVVEAGPLPPSAPTKVTSPPVVPGPLGSALSKAVIAIQRFRRREVERIEQQGLRALFAAAGIDEVALVEVPTQDRDLLASALRDLLQLVEPAPPVSEVRVIAAKACEAPEVRTPDVLPEPTQPDQPAPIPDPPPVLALDPTLGDVLENSDREMALRRKAVLKEEPTPAPVLEALVVQDAPPPAAKPVTVQGPEDRDVEAAHALLKNVAELTELHPQEPPARLEALIQAHVAECRMLLERVPEWHALFPLLSRAIPAISRIRAQSGINAYIKGLARAHQENWPRLLRESKERVARFDADTDLSVSRKQAPVRKEKEKKPKEQDATCPWPNLSSYNKAGNTVVLVGGLSVPDKLRSIRKRWGLNAEWYEVDQGETRAGDAVASKIDSGRIGAVIVLEGLLSRGVSDKITTSAKAKGTPFAMADRGGTAHLERALSEIEARLSKRSLSAVT